MLHQGTSRQEKPGYRVTVPAESFTDHSVGVVLRNIQNGKHTASPNILLSCSGEPCCFSGTA